MPTRVRPLFACLLALSLVAPLAALPARAGKLADLPWITSIPQEIRSGIRSALWKESNEITKEKNAAGKRFIRLYANEFVEFEPDGRPASYVTIQKCLEDRMVTERWKYVFEKKGRDWEIVDRRKVAEVDDAYPTLLEEPDHARAARGFDFQHDLFSLHFDGGSGIVRRHGKHADAFAVAGSGHVTLKPLDDYEKIFFERSLGAETLDDDIEAVELEFHPLDEEKYLALVGWTPAAVREPGGGPVDSGHRSILQRIYNEETRDQDKRRYTPSFYSPYAQDAYRGYFAFRVKTKHHGWIVYAYRPWAIRQITAYREKKGAGLQGKGKEYDTLLSIYDPETRKLPRIVREHRRGIRWTDPYRYEAMFDIDSDRFDARIDVDTVILRDTGELTFRIAGNPKVHFVKDGAGRELVFTPYPSDWKEQKFGEENANAWRVLFPEPLRKGQRLHLTISYSSPDIVRKVDEGFWYIQRGGFLPFAGTLSDPAFMHFVIRSKDDYQHVSVGSKISEETVDGYRYSEWGADHTFNFPTLIIGKYYDPVEMEADDVHLVGYMTKSFRGDPSAGIVSLPTPTRKAMIPQVEQAANSIRIFSRMFGIPYPFRDLKLVGTPAQFGSAQSPSSIVYVGELFFWPKQFVANWMRANPNEFAGTVAHEVSHQWWGGLVSNISQYHYWFVETLAQVSEALHDEIIKPGEGYQLQLEQWRDKALQADWQCSVQDAPIRPHDFIGYTNLVYYKGPYVIHMLGEYFGHTKLRQFLKNLATSHAEDLISTTELQQVAERTFGTNLEWYFDQWIRNVGYPEVHYSISSPRKSEDGKSWLVDVKLHQDIMYRGRPMPGRWFRNLLVPFRVTPSEGEPFIQKVLMKGPDDTRTLRFDSKPRKIEINPDNRMYIVTKKM